MAVLVCVAALPAGDLEAGPSCRPMKGVHLPSCVDVECRGCEPRKPEHPHTVCTACRLGLHDQLVGRPGRPALPGLAEIHLDLDTPTRTAAGGSGPNAASGEPGPDRRRDLRDAIRGVLVWWTHYLHHHHGVLPAAWNVRALAHHVDAWTPRILLEAGPASQLVHDIGTLHRDGARLAYPGGGRGQLLGHCPDCKHPVRSETTWEARCPGCGAVRSIDQWRALLAGDLSGETVATKAQLAAWLSAVYSRAISPLTISNWRNRPTAGLGRLVEAGVDQRGRKLYDVAHASQIAARLYGQAPNRGIAS
jgi:hypothetical protein